MTHMASQEARGTAPGKIILFGEHAVVYGQPAIAIPIPQIRATATVRAAPPGEGLTLIASDLGETIALASAPEQQPLAAITRATLNYLGLPPPDAALTIRSAIPIASGLGSGTAVSTAIARALAAYAGVELPPAVVSELVFEVEKLYHGTPSGIDNTVIAYGMPVYYVKGQPVETFQVGGSFMLLIADTGVASPTRAAVEDVRQSWKVNPERYERIFKQIGRWAVEARELIEAGGPAATLGELMDLNHDLLREMGVSSPRLEQLVKAARRTGALGAKLSGGGRGGNIIVLIAPADKARVSRVLRRAGATRVIEAMLAPAARDHQS